MSHIFIKPNDDMPTWAIFYIVNRMTTKLGLFEITDETEYSFNSFSREMKKKDAQETAHTNLWRDCMRSRISKRDISSTSLGDITVEQSRGFKEDSSNIWLYFQTKTLIFCNEWKLAEIELKNGDIVRFGEIL